MILLLVCEANICQAEELPHIPGTELQWGMTYKQANQYLPETNLGQIDIRQSQFAHFPAETHPVAGQFYFSAADSLEYVQFYPLYHYPKRTNWQADYEHINSYMVDVYGDPYKTTNTQTIWLAPDTQGQFLRYETIINGSPVPNGWAVRFDMRGEE